MKKICMCTTVSLTMKTFVVETAKHLHEKCGYDITLICNDDKEFEKSLPEYLHFIPVKMSRGVDFSALKSIKQFIKIFKEQKFDMVQYSTPNAACYASIAARMAKVPVRLYCQWGIRYVGLHGISRKVFKTIEKTVCRNSTDIRAVSPNNLEFAIAEGLYPDGKAKVLGIGGTIGVDLSDYPVDKKTEWRTSVRKNHEINEGFVFGFAGRLSRDKGGNELLSAVKRLIDEGNDISLLIVGSNESDGGIDDELLRWADESDRVVETGFVAKSDMPMYYAAINALVHPTYREGFGMVLQEAGAMGCPIITTNIPGASEVMEKDVSCILAEPKNTESLYICMKKILDDAEFAQNIGKAARKRAETYFERKIMLENQRKDYEELVGR